MINANSIGLSYKTYVYHHKDSNGGWIAGRHIEKNVTTWYTKTNYGGHNTTKTTYSVKVIE